MDTAGLFEPSEVARLRRNLRHWHARHGRTLPWRQAGDGDGDAYRVWISEIMLQQTTVAAVLPYYKRFLVRFPTVHSLAAAGEEDVLRLWEGLGYYSRARNMHRASRLIAADRAGRFPQEVGDLMTLPGIGRYTAGAIASFAFDRPAPIVEANTLRLYCRLLGYDGDPRSTAGQRLLWSFAGQLVPRKAPGEFNQALIDLGATVCTVSEPACAGCPLGKQCRARAEGRIDEIPRQSQRIASTELVEAAVAVAKNGMYLLHRRGFGERWAGLWDFLRFGLPGHASAAVTLPERLQAEVLRGIRDLSGLEVGPLQSLTSIRHSVTRYRITLHCLRARWNGGRLRKQSAPMRWVKPADFDRYPLSATGRKFARVLTPGGANPGET